MVDSNFETSFDLRSTSLHQMPFYRHSQCKRPFMLDRQKQPNYDPQKQMQDRSDDTGQNRAIQTAPVDERIIIQKRCIANSNRQQATKRCTVRKISPAAASVDRLGENVLRTALVVQKRIKPEKKP